MFWLFSPLAEPGASEPVIKKAGWEGTTSQIPEQKLGEYLTPVLILLPPGQEHG